MAKRRLFDGARTHTLAALKAQVGPALARRLPHLTPAKLQAAAQNLRKAALGDASGRSALGRLKPPDHKAWQQFEDYLHGASAEELEAFLAIRENAEQLSRKGLRNLYVVFPHTPGSTGSKTPVATTRKPHGGRRPAPDQSLADVVHATLATPEQESFAAAARTLGMAPNQAMLVVLRLLDTVRPDQATRAQYPSTRGGFLAEMGIFQSPAVRQAEMATALESIRQILQDRPAPPTGGGRLAAAPDETALRSAITAVQEGHASATPSSDVIGMADPVAALRNALAAGGVARITRDTWLVRTTEVRDNGAPKGKLVTDRTLMLVEWRGTDTVVLHPISIAESKLRSVAHELPGQLVESSKRLAQGVSGADVLPRTSGLKIEVRFPKRLLAVAFHETVAGRAQFDAAAMRRVPASVKRALQRPDLKVDLLPVDGTPAASAARHLISMGLRALDQLNRRPGRAATGEAMGSNIHF